MNVLIQQGKIVTPKGIVSGDIEVQNGTIFAIHRGGISSGFDGMTYSAHNRYILPGGVETHGHFREPGLEHKEDISHGTRAALAGGFTSVFDMPNTKPPNTTVERLQEQIQRYAEKSFCDFAINFGAEVGNHYLHELEGVNPQEVTGVKVFMAGHQTTPTTVTEKKDQAQIWKVAGKKGLPILAHAEDQQLVTQREHLFQQQGRMDMLAYSEARNEEVVITAAKKAMELSLTYGTALWILHASTAGEFECIREGRKQGLKTGGEVAGYQLFFTTDDYEKLGTRIKVSPALRAPALNKHLWQMVRDGMIDGLCSEHTPHTLEEKERDVWSAVSGMPTIQETIPAFLTGWIREFGEKTIEEGLIRLATMISTNIANFFDYPEKSGIVVGNDADLVIIDMEHPWLVQKEDLFTKCQWSAYEGMSLLGRPAATFLRGALVYEDGQIKGDHVGRWLKKDRKEKINET